jgi:GT2 family glycosyltransferase
MYRVIQCPFREGTRRQDESEVAICRLLKQLSGLEDSRMCEVRRDACEACCETFAPTANAINPVVASLLYDLANRVVDLGGVGRCTIERALEIQEWAEHQLETDEPGESDFVLVPNRTPNAYCDRSLSCDVIVCCTDTSELTHRAVRSVLAQQHVAVHVHLIDDGGGAGELVARYGRERNVSIYRNSRPRGLFATLHDLVPKLRTDYVAVQDPTTRSRPYRLAYSVGLLSEYGGELLAAPLQTPFYIEEPRVPELPYRRYVPAPTLVLRRASLVDMGGMSDRSADADAELVYRAACERRMILFAREATVDAEASWIPGALGTQPAYEPRDGTLGHHARGFPSQHIACDVVLPFHGHLDFVEEALPSVLEQEGADAVVHLVDDATSDCTEAFLRRWGSHARVRTYRNNWNIGQFATFNNVLPFLETDLVAVQDADDISLPHRMHVAGNALALTDAEIFAGRVRLFGAEKELLPTLSHSGEHTRWRRRPEWRMSHYSSYRRGYFLENPTAVMRVRAFTRLGGFGDFGDPYRNRCGLDTEFYLRAFFAGARFAITRRVVLHYRCHPESATQNQLTGWGSLPRSWSEEECRRRASLYQQEPFDPTLYGGLRNYAGVTRRVCC